MAQSYDTIAPQLADWAKELCEEIAESTAANMRVYAPAKTGGLRKSIVALGNEVYGNEYGIYVDAKVPFISKSIKES